MKNILPFVLGLSLMLSACDMEERPYTINDSMTQTEEGAALAVTAMYNTFWSTSLMKKSYMECIDMDHDHSAAPSWVMSGAGEGNMTNHWSYNTSSDPFYAFYALINRANYVIEKVAESPIDETVRNQYLGEAYFLRAFSYFHRVRMYGPVPLRLKYDDLGDKARSSVQEVYQRITDDLDDACTLMTEWGTSSGNWGHANKTAAKILLARVYATMGSAALAGSVDMMVDIKGSLDNFTTTAVAGFEGVDAKKCYEKVVEICDEVIARKGIDYDYMPAFNKIWGAPNFRNKEFVWGVAGNALNDFTTEHLGYYYTAPTYYGRGWAGITEHAYGLYTGNDERGEHGIFHYIKQTWNNTSNYVRMPDDPETYPTGPDGKPARSNADYFRTYFITKWYTGDGTVDNPIPNTTEPGYALKEQDVILIRFIELYLLRAEAYNELDFPDKALADLDVVRARAKADLLSGTTSDKTEIRSLILQERAMEFMQEFNRKFDLLRWGLYLDVMNKTQSVRIQGTGLSISKVRQPRSILYAVPLNEINNNRLFGPNNSGY